MSQCRKLIAFLFLTSCLVLAGAGPVGSGVGEHGWCVYRNTLGQLVLVHLPPRTGQGTADVEPGSALAIRPLKVSPHAMATHDAAVFLVFPPTVVNDRPIRRVSTGRAIPTSGATGVWLFDPASHLNAKPSLPGQGTLHNFVAPKGVLHALLETEGVWTLHRLGNDGWNTIELPAGDTQDRMLIAWDETVLVLSRSSAGTTTAFVRTPGETWDPITIAGLDRIWDASFVLGHNHELIAGFVDADDALGIHVLRESSDLLVHTIADPPEEMGTMILDGSNALVLVSRIPATKDQRSSIRLIELDLTSGRILYDGPPLQQALLNSDAARLLLMMFFAMGSLVVLIVIRPPSDGVFLLPDRCAIAEPFRRFAAMLIDLGILSSILAPLFGVGVFELLTGNVLGRPDTGWLALPALLIAGMINSTIWESLLGATPGKLAMQLRVVRAQQGNPKPLPMHLALVRNAIKWLLPPVTMLSIVDPGYRHRADVASKAVVTVRIQSDEKAKAEDQEEN